MTIGPHITLFFSLLSHKQKKSGQSKCTMRMVVYERPAVRGLDEDDDEERGLRLHKLMPLTDEEPTYRRKQVHYSKLHDRLECEKII